jgi:hypothetical protein
MEFAGEGDTFMAWMNHFKEGDSNADSSGSQKDPNRKPRTWTLLGLMVLMLAGGSVFGYALYRAQFILNPKNESTTTAAVKNQETCQELIDRAIKSSGDSCNGLGDNEMCYGNNTLVVELNPGNTKQFSRQGDIINVEYLKRLAASPLNLASKEWGIAVFKVMANLPRSLPGETITMMAFGNTTLDNKSKNLETFYFSSSLGQIVCDKVPFDGLMITMPDGSGINFVINGAEMTLTGNASLKATKNGSMDISMFSGSALITSNGQTQLVTAGQKTSMNLGGPDGTSAVSPPSVPQPLSADELVIACTMTGQFCSQQQITPVDGGDALATLQTGLGLNSTGASVETSQPVPTATLTSMPSFTIRPNQTRTKTSMPASILTATQVLTRTYTLFPSLTTTSPLTATTPPPPTATTPPPPTATTLPPPTATNLPPPTATNPPPPTATNPPPPTSVPMITICHQTGSGSYSEITIPNTGSGGHWNHPNDLIPAPAGGCP